ncbi:hypothetical protein ACH4M4_33425 [Streptomyces sp. NPDC017254]|uniref:hypothetical protein n=1 Tax=Streptomyces sp. NPDC017254 TaxID=3364989 RepID=UPI0037A579CB
MDSDDSVKVLEDVAHVFGLLPGDQRQELIDVLREMAEAESGPARREFLEGFPEGFGLAGGRVLSEPSGVLRGWHGPRPPAMRRVPAPGQAGPPNVAGPRTVLNGPGEEPGATYEE